MVRIPEIYNLWASRPGPMSAGYNEQAMHEMSAGYNNLLVPGAPSTPHPHTLTHPPSPPSIACLAVANQEAKDHYISRDLFEV
jgi:hypothetical protein